MQVVPLPHHPLLSLHDSQTLTAEHDEPFLGIFGVVVAERLPGLEDVDVNTDARPVGWLGPVEVAPRAEARNGSPRHLPKVEDEPAFTGRQPALFGLLDMSLVHVAAS